MRAPTMLAAIRSDHVRSHYTVKVAHGDSFEQAMSAAYWQHVETQLRPLDLVDLVAEDGAFDATIRVVSAVKGALSFRVLRFWQPVPASPARSVFAGSGETTSPAAPVPDPVSAEGRPETVDTGLSVGWGGPQHKFRVVDDTTKDVVAHGFESRELADIAAANLARARAA